MNNPAQKVGEIFREAAKAFEKLSEMTLLLHPMEEGQPGGKWTEEEIDMLRNSVHRFAIDLNKLSLHIKSRTVSQICTMLKKKAFEDAGIPVRPVSSSVPSHVSHTLQPPPPPPPPAQVTLNMLNAPENEVDVEGLSGDVKLEFENNDDVPT